MPEVDYEDEVEEDEGPAYDPDKMDAEGHIQTPDMRTFAEELEEASADFVVYEYHGRYYYRGPAVNVEDEDGLVAVIRATSVPLQWDSMGRGWVVYPK